MSTIQNEDKLQTLIEIIIEIFQVNVSMWRIIYSLFEIGVQIFIYFIAPVLLFKVVRWGWNVIFSKDKESD